MTDDRKYAELMKEIGELLAQKTSLSVRKIIRLRAYNAS